MKNLFLLLLLFIISFSSNIKSQEKKLTEIILREGKWSNVVLPGETPLPIVKISITFNNNALIINAEVKDNHFKDGDRSWRYGDGFYINFVNQVENEKDSSNKFYGFGFSLQNKKPFSVLVNKDGTYFPTTNPPPLPEIKIDSVKMTALYKINIPWKNVYPFHPFKDNTAGINIVYISQNNDGSRIIQRLITDNYDTELSDYRKFIPLKFILSEKHKTSVVGNIKNRVSSSLLMPMSLWIRSPKREKVLIKISAENQNSSIVKKQITKRIAVGINKINYSIKLPKNNGLYNIPAEINDSVFWKDDFYKYSDDTFNQSLKLITMLTAATENQEIKLSGSTIIYHINNLRQLIKNFNSRSDISKVKFEFETLSGMLSDFTNNNSIFTNGGMAVCGFKSPIDSTLQPFSIILPNNFDKTKTYNLMVVLHGSGVDETKSINDAAKNFSDYNFIFMAPRGRNLSSWYIGDAETDLIALTKNIKTVFNINKVIIYGFSMGGYGVWRNGILNPELFDAGIVVSGAPFNFKDNNPEYNMNNFLSNKTKIPYLVIHGTADRSLDISYTDTFVEKLKLTGFNVEYVRIEGAGHGNFNSTNYICNWLKTLNFLN